jgi:TolB-like protein
VHRDLKPSNVFLTPHGVKLLDFGLARPTDPRPRRVGVPAAGADLTRTGMVLGTPRYMAPEQVTGDGLDARSDLFAVGAILFEMLAGRPAFTGRNAVEILHATLYEQPPALSGSPAVAAVDRVIRRALAKRPAERPGVGRRHGRGAARVNGMEGDSTKALARPLTRLVVLPFRILRPDPETDFLAFSLPDAIATSLSRIGSLVVRSSATAARFAGEAPDLKALASAADVDRVVMGTLVRSGDQLRAVAQLVEAPGGTLVTSHTVQSSLGDLFQLQDDIAQRVVDALALPLGGSTDTPTPQQPHNARAYALYLQGNQHARSYGGLQKARELYQQSLELDPKFAPAWAQLGRCHRVIGKFIDGGGDSDSRAEQALAKALELNPHLTLAHKYFRAPRGRDRKAAGRAGAAAGRGDAPRQRPGALRGPRSRRPLLRAVRAGDRGARGGAPARPERAVERRADGADDGRHRPAARAAADRDRHRQRLGDRRDRPRARRPAGRGDEGARGAQAPGAARDLPRLRRHAARLARARPADMRANVAALSGLKIMNDPEAMFQEGWLLCDVGEHAAGIDFLRRAVDKGYTVAPHARAGPGLRRAARRSRLRAAGGRRAGRLRPGARGVPRERRRAAAGPLSGPPFRRRTAGGGGRCAGTPSAATRLRSSVRRRGAAASGSGCPRA